MRCSEELKQLSSKSSGGKKTLLKVRALLFYEKDYIISSRVSGRLNDPISENVFHSKHTFQQLLQWPGVATQGSEQSHIALTSPLFPLLLAAFWVRIAKIFLMFDFQFNIEHNVPLSFF